jgi:hypothetical protein
MADLVRGLPSAITESPHPRAAAAMAGWRHAAIGIKVRQTATGQVRIKKNGAKFGLDNPALEGEC